MEELEVRFFLTATISEAMQSNKAMQKAVEGAVRDFTRGQYGIIPQENIEANKEDLKHLDGHILGRYKTPAEDIYINMTFEENEEGKTYGQALVMFCSEY